MSGDGWEVVGAKKAAASKRRAKKQQQQQRAADPVNRTVPLGMGREVKERTKARIPGAKGEQQAQKKKQQQKKGGKASKGADEAFDAFAGVWLPPKVRKQAKRRERRYQKRKEVKAKAAKGDASSGTGKGGDRSRTGKLASVVKQLPLDEASASLQAWSQHYAKSVEAQLRKMGELVLAHLGQVALDAEQKEHPWSDPGFPLATVSASSQQGDAYVAMLRQVAKKGATTSPADCAAFVWLMVDHLRSQSLPLLPVQVCIGVTAQSDATEPLLVQQWSERMGATSVDVLPMHAWLLQQLVHQQAEAWLRTWLAHFVPLLTSSGSKAVAPVVLRVGRFLVDRVAAQKTGAKGVTTDQDVELATAFLDVASGGKVAKSTAKALHAMAASVLCALYRTRGAPQKGLAHLYIRTIRPLDITHPASKAAINALVTGCTTSRCLDALRQSYARNTFAVAAVVSALRTTLEGKDCDMRDDPPRALCDFLESIVDVSAGLVDGTTKLRDRVAKSAERPWQDVVSACGADARACLACLSQAPSSGSRRVLLLLVFVVFALLAVVGSVVLANDPFALRPVWNVYREHPVVHRVQTLIADVGQAAQQSFSRITQ